MLADSTNYLFLKRILKTVIYIFLVITKQIQAECQWSVELGQCPDYGTTDWHCLKSKLNCPDGEKYHCVRNSTNRSWVQICDSVRDCVKGQEPVYSTNFGIECKPCKDPDSYEPAERTPSNRYSQCRKKKGACNKTTSTECINENAKYNENRKCRCLYEEDFIPQKSTQDRCIDVDNLVCVQRTCVDSVDGRHQSRDADYRCSPASSTPEIAGYNSARYGGGPVGSIAAIVIGLVRLFVT